MQYGGVVIHLVIFGYAAVGFAGLIIWARTRPDQKFTRWQVLQVALLLAFAFAAIKPDVAVTLFPKAVDVLKAWVGK